MASAGEPLCYQLLFLLSTLLKMRRGIIVNGTASSNLQKGFLLTDNPVQVHCRHCLHLTWHQLPCMASLAHYAISSVCNQTGW